MFIDDAENNKLNYPINCIPYDKRYVINTPLKLGENALAHERFFPLNILIKLVSILTNAYSQLSRHLPRHLLRHAANGPRPSRLLFSPY
jgi:hypothetical protein